MLKEKILGSLLGAALADSMGAATEMRTTEQIKDFFGGRVTDIIAPPEDTFARGNKPGQVTDDFSLGYVTLKEIIKNQGKVNKEVAINSLLAWSEDESFFNRFAGPTTRAAIEALREGKEVISSYGFDLVCDNSKATNGAAMKAAPVALLSLGDVDKAIANCMIISQQTHDNNTALSGAGAVACATAKALQSSITIEDIVEAGLYGAKEGDDYGIRNCKTLANPSVYKKIKYAISKVIGIDKVEEVMEFLSDVIGTNVFAYESVPAAFALIYKYQNSPMDGIIAAVNAGDDTDSVATIVGGVLGAYNGIEAFPKNYLKIINEANGYDLELLTDEIIRFGGK